MSRTLSVSSCIRNFEQNILSADTMTDVQVGIQQNNQLLTWLSFFHKFKIGANSLPHLSLSNLCAPTSDLIMTFN